MKSCSVCCELIVDPADVEPYFRIVDSKVGPILSNYTNKICTRRMIRGTDIDQEGKGL